MTSTVKDRIGVVTQRSLPPELERLMPEETTAEEKQSVANYLYQLDLFHPTDPFTLGFVAMLGQQLGLEKAPDKIRAAVAAILRELDERMEGIEAATAKKVELREIKLRDELSRRLNPLLSPWGILRNALALTISLGVGAAGGYAIVDNRPLDPSGPVQLSLEQAEILSWAESSEGRRARQIIEWNEGLRSGACEREVKNAGVSFSVGNQVAIDGFCFVWVRPSESRRYRDAD